MKKFTVIVAMVLVAVFAVSASSEKLITSASPVVSVLLDVTNMTELPAENDNPVHRLRGQSSEFVTVGGENFIKLASATAEPSTSNRIYLVLNRSIVGYEYIRIRMKNASTSEMKGYYSFDGGRWVILNSVLTDLEGNIVSINEKTSNDHIHTIPANFDGYVFLKLTSLYCVHASGGQVFTRTADSTETLTLDPYTLDPTNVTATFAYQFGGVVGSESYYGDIVLCGAAAPVAPSPSVAPSVAPSVVSSPSPTADSTVKVLLDVTNATDIAEGTPEHLSRLRGKSVALTTVSDEKLIKIVVASDTDNTANRIQLAVTDSIVGYEYIRVRLKNDSDDIMTVRSTLGGARWIMQDSILTDLEGNVIETQEDLHDHEVPANFNGYMYIKLTNFFAVGGDYAMRTADSDEVMSCPKEDGTEIYTLDPENIEEGFFFRFVGAVDSTVYVGDIVLCEAEALEPGTTNSAGSNINNNNPSMGAVTVVLPLAVAALSGIFVCVRKRH